MFISAFTSAKRTSLFWSRVIYTAWFTWRVRINKRKSEGNLMSREHLATLYFATVWIYILYIMLPKCDTASVVRELQKKVASFRSYRHSLPSMAVDIQLLIRGLLRWITLYTVRSWPKLIGTRRQDRLDVRCDVEVRERVENKSKQRQERKWKMETKNGG
jgi:hypothetical protein